MSVINGSGRHFNGGECNKPAAVEGILTVVSVISGGGRYTNGVECNKRWLTSKFSDFPLGLEPVKKEWNFA